LSAGEHQDAVKDYDEALDLCYQFRDLLEELDIDLALEGENATLVGVLNNCAWVLATSPKDDLRDGKRAIELATEAAELTDFKEAYILSTLASGYAETGEFDSAIEWIDKAIAANTEEGEKLAEEKNQKEQVTRNAEQSESLQKEKDSYVAKKPWRELQDVEAEKAAAEEKAKDVDDADAEDADDDAKSQDESADDEMKEDSKTKDDESKEMEDKSDDDSKSADETPESKQDMPEADDSGSDADSTEPQGDAELEAEPENDVEPEPETTPDTDEPDEI